MRSGTHGRELSDQELKTEVSSIQIDLNDPNYPDQLKNEHQQRSSLDSAKYDLLAKMSPRRSGVPLPAPSSKLRSSSKQTAQFPSPRSKTNCSDCMALTKKLLNSEARKLEMTLQLARQKLQGESNSSERSSLGSAMMG